MVLDRSNTTINQRFEQVYDSLRINYKLTKKEFCKRINVIEQSFSGLISGQRNISTEIVRELSREFNVSEKFMISGDGLMFKDESLTESSSTIKSSNVKYLEQKGVLIEDLPFIKKTAYASFVEQCCDDIRWSDFETYPIINPTGKKIKNGFLVEVQGNSMAPDFVDGEIIVVSKIDESDWCYVNGVHAVVYADFFVLKHVSSKQYFTDNILMLKSYNPENEVYPVRVKDIRGVYKYEFTAYRRNV